MVLSGYMAQSLTGLFTEHIIMRFIFYEDMFLIKRGIDERQKKSLMVEWLEQASQ